MPINPNDYKDLTLEKIEEVMREYFSAKWESIEDFELVPISDTHYQIRGKIWGTISMKEFNRLMQEEFEKQKNKKPSK